MESLDLSPSTQKPRVCITGAGISGLRAADLLLQSDCSVTIFEARDRIGGRVHQSDQLGYPADIGPNWIHTSGNILSHRLAKETNTALHAWNENNRVFDGSGVQISEDKAKKLSDIRWTIIEEAFTYSKMNKQTIPANDSLYDFLVHKTVDMDLSPDDRRLLLDMSQMWGCYTGDSIERQSLRFAFLEVCCGGDESIVASSFKSILDKIAAPALAKANMLLKQKVIAVENTDSSERTVSITTDDGTVQSFDALIVTTPLGWLKSNASEVFSPPLPTNILQAIAAISVGHLEKIFINFPRAFWRSDIKEGSEDPFPLYTNWTAPSYAPDTNPNQWPQEAYDLAAFAPPNTRPTLLFYAYGDGSIHISSQIHNKPVAIQYEFLNSFFKPYYSRLPGYDASDPTCQPKTFLASSWQHDELAGYGSYCNFQIGIENGDECVEAFRRGCPDRSIWFAGEHAAPEEEMGTVSGAYFSGEEAARNVLSAFGHTRS